MSQGEQQPGTKGFVYFLRRADGVGPIKIGCSQVPKSRLKALQVWSPEPLEIVAFVPGTFGDEQRLHRQFARHRLHGEWFEAAPPVLATMARVAALGELPPPLPNDRNVAIMARYHAGETLQAIAEVFGVTRQRIEQIVRKEGGVARGPGGRKSAPVWQKLEAVRSLASRGFPCSEIAQAIGDSRQNVYVACRASGIALARKKRQRSERVTATAFDIAADYKAGLSTYEIAQKHGRQQPEIYRFLRIAGVKPDRRYRYNACLPTHELVAAYRAGSTVSDIAAARGASRRLVTRLLTDGGITSEEREQRRRECVAEANRRRRAA